MTDEQRELIWKTVGMLWALASMKNNPFATIAADFAEDLFVTFHGKDEEKE